MQHIHIIALLIFAFVVCHQPLGQLRFKRSGNPLMLVVLIYIISGISSYFVGEEVMPTFDFSAHKYYYYFAYTFFSILVLIPIYFLRGYRLTGISLRAGRSLRLTYIIASIGIWFSLAYQLPYAVLAMSMGAKTVRDGLNVESVSVLPVSYLTTLAVGISSFYVIFIVMFYMAIVKRMGFYYKISMLAGGALYFVSSICFSARDGAIFFALTMLFGFYLFRDLMSDGAKKKVFRVISVFGVIAIVFLCVFSYQRFFESGDVGNLVSGTLGYIGQQPYVFAETIASQVTFYGLDLRLPLISSILFGKVPDVVRYVPYEWSFGTFLKDYYAMYGWTSLVTLSVFTAFLFGFIFFNNKKYHPVTFLIALSFYFQFMTSGVFYFRLGTMPGNQYMVIVLLLFLGGKIFLRRGGVYVMNSRPFPGGAGESGVCGSR